MPDFHCYMCNAEGKILFGDIIIAESLDTALEHASELRRKKNQSRPSSRLIYAYEIWSGSNRMIPASLVARPESKQVAYPLTPTMARHALAL
jgi:hypothetical protein